MLVKSSTHNTVRIFGVKKITLHGYVSLEMKFVNFLNFSFFSFFFHLRQVLSQSSEVPTSIDLLHFIFTHTHTPHHDSAATSDSRDAGPAGRE